MLIDTHCHLTDMRLSDTEGVLARAKGAGVGRMICPMTEVAEWKAVRDLIETEEGVYALAGIHPENLEKIENIGEEINKMKEILKHPKVVGVGEIGLDFYYDKEKKSKDKQIELFQAQVEMAIAAGKPVAIHMREAEEEMREIMRRWKIVPKGQFHCFAGSGEFLDEALKMGFFISFCGNITFKKAENLRERAQKTPLERLLLETDSPYLAPEPIRGSVNEPANVKIIAEYIAQLLSVDFMEVAGITSENANHVYFAEILNQ